MSTKITFESKYGEVSVNVEADDLTLQEVVAKLIRPAMLAVGYHNSTINKCIPVTDDD